MKTIASIIAAIALTASFAHADIASGWTEVIASDAPDCLDVFGGWSGDSSSGALEVFHDCDEAVVLTCPLAGGCAIDGKPPADELVLSPGWGGVVHVPAGSGDVRWQLGDAVGTIAYEEQFHEDYECGLSVLACTASPGVGGRDMGWLAFALIGLGLVRRRARGERA